MIKDLRKLINKTVAKLNPINHKKIDKHLLLSDILYKELKKEDIDIKRDNVNLIISLKKNKRVTIDCLDGTIYTNDNINIGKLRKFSVDHSGEIYNCAVKNVKRIMKKIRNIESEINNDNVTFKDQRVKDFRKFNSFKKSAKIYNIMDLREHKNIVDLRSYSNLIDLRDHKEVIDLRKFANVIDKRNVVNIVDFRDDYVMPMHL